MMLSEKQKAKIKDVAIRSGKTFAQTTIGCITAAIAGVTMTDLNAVKAAIGSVIISAIAAGVCAVWNGVISPLLNGGKSNE